MNNELYDKLKNTSRVKTALADEIMNEIGLRVVSQTYEAGDYLDDETALAERYQVSKGVIHDAIKSLTLKGLLEARRGIGIRVRHRRLWKLLDDDVLSWMISSPANIDFYHQLMDIRLCFEPHMSHWAAERATENDLANLDKAYLALVNAKSNEQVTMAMAFFHQVILQAANNEFLNVIEGVIYCALLVKSELAGSGKVLNDSLFDCYHALYLSIKDNDGKRAAELSNQLLNTELSNSKEIKIEVLI